MSNQDDTSGSEPVGWFAPVLLPSGQIVNTLFPSLNAAVFAREKFESDWADRSRDWLDSQNS